MKSHPFLSRILFLAVLALFTSPLYAVHADDKTYIDDVAVPEPYLEKSADKLVRGVTNIVSSPAEIPKQMVVTTRERGAVGPVVGLVKGTGMTVVRIITGAWETVTFLFPNDMEGNFDPIVKPEYVWDPSAPAH